MNQKVCVFLADGFEEIEGLTVVDILRRGKVDTQMVAIGSECMVEGSHGIKIEADVTFDEADFQDTCMLVLPGGIPGTPNLQGHKGLEELLKTYDRDKKYIAAICAAPSIFGALGFLEDREACCHPSKEEVLRSKVVSREPVVVSDHIITSRGMGTAIPFGLKLLELLEGEEVVNHVKNGIVY